ncbi:MAG: 3-oxoacyl-[acyl-carrier-protein] reductase [Hyphomonadaceae bacterium]|nr:3-oxoacyl-[acyl-carrier-protein] reductase [Clostridia bacterium]
MLKGTTSIVTGGARGIGKGIATKLAKMGSNIVLNYRSSDDEAIALKTALEAFGVTVLLHKGDISVQEDAKALIEAAMQAFGRIDVLVNNAGITKDGLIMRMSVDDFDTVINVNLKGAFLCTRFATTPMLKQKSGKIINISSVVGISGNAGQANYAASKAGLIGLTKSVAKELGGKNITVNAVAPGFIETDMTDKLSEKTKEALVERISLKRLGTVEDIANIVGFLASNEANYITGQVIAVDGGLVI